MPNKDSLISKRAAVQQDIDRVVSQIAELDKLDVQSINDQVGNRVCFALF
jgi:hypothetical protein